MPVSNGPASCKARSGTSTATTAPATSTKLMMQSSTDPVVEEGLECICLVALQGQIRFNSWIGRLVQPFVRI